MQESTTYTVGGRYDLMTMKSSTNSLGVIDLRWEHFHHTQYGVKSSEQPLQLVGQMRSKDPPSSSVNASVHVWKNEGVCLQLLNLWTIQGCIASILQVISWMETQCNREAQVEDCREHEGTANSKWQDQELLGRSRRQVTMSGVQQEMPPKFKLPDLLYISFNLHQRTTVW